MKELMDKQRDRQRRGRCCQSVLTLRSRCPGWQRYTLRPATSYAFPMVIFVLALTGCQVPKNVAPFVDATGALHQAINASGAVTAEAMAAVPGVLPSNRAPRAKKDVAAFLEIWQDRVKLMDVLLGYSDALAGVAAANASARENVGALGSAMTRLAAIVPATGSAVAAGVQLGQVLIRTGIEIKAFHDLSQAVQAAHPALAEVAKFLAADLQDLSRLYLKASQDLESALDLQYGERESQRRKLLEKRSVLRTTMLDSFNDVTVEHVIQIEELLAHTASEHQAYTQQYRAILLKRITTRQMFEKATQGVRAWVQAHEELNIALQQNRQPNVRLMLATAQEIKAAVDRIRNL